MVYLSSSPAARTILKLISAQDQTILATVTPTISDHFHALRDVGWWSASYLFTLSVFQLFYGKLYAIYSIKLVYLAAIGIFELGSLICAVSPNSSALISGRAVAGLGAAGIFSGSIMVTTKVIPLERRATYLGVMSAVFGVAAIVGPFIGGAIAEQSTWRWCFWLNLPLGLVTVVLCAFLVRTPPDRNTQPLSSTEKLRQFDLVGTVTLIGSLVCLLLALEWGGSTYPWKSARVIALFVAAAVLAAVFVLAQTLPKSRFTARTIPSSITASRSVWMAGSYAMCITGGVYVAILYIPLWFQVIQHRSALGSSVMLTPLIVGYVVCSVIAGILTSAIGYYNPSMIVGTILAACGSGLLTTITPHTNTGTWIGYQALYGLGVGLGFGQPSYVVQTVLPEKDVSMGVTLITLVQNLSATVFVAAAQTIFQNSLADRLRSLVPGVSASSIAQTGATQLLEQFPASDRPAVLDTYSSALVQTFYLSLGLSCASVVGAALSEWRSMKAPKSETGQARPGGEGSH
ncbi:major facilitator superfamily-domain-containing protein [Aspergillus recurvatus]